MIGKKRAFQRRLFALLFVLSLVPAAAVLVGTTAVLREAVATAGTAGPWDEVAASGRDLLELVEERAPHDPAIEEAAGQHRDALSESLRLSRLHAFLGERVLELLPFLAGGLVLLVGVLSLVAARALSRQLSRPLEELEGWAERVGRGEPLPEPEPHEERGAREFQRLRREFREMESQLNDARRREVEAARLRSWTEMARSVAHELKNPLSPMRMAAGRVARAQDPSVAEAGQVLLEEIDGLDEMARSFSQLGRLPEGAFAPVDLADLLDGLVQRLNAPGAVPVSLEVDQGVPEVAGQYDALERVLRNLVANAREAHAVGAVVHGDDDAGHAEPVGIRLEGRDGAAVLRILDRGPGLPTGEGPDGTEGSDRIWEPGYTTKSRGTGLGLFLARRTVEAHGGTLRARNREGGGAEFTLILPATEGEGS